MGNLNELTNSNENQLNIKEILQDVQFNKFIRHMSLLDIGYSGQPFTWHNERNNEEGIFET